MPKALQDIRWWIAAFLLFRLIGITNPPVETSHNWRQTSVAMVARNFVEVEADILHPRVDIAGDASGITGMEFPLLNYLIFLVAKVFGYAHWYGRLINLLVSSLGLWCFHRLVRTYFSANTALHATIILAASIWFPYARKVMPDTFSVSLVIAGLYAGSRYLQEANGRSRAGWLVACTVLIMFGTLSKLTAGSVLVVLALFVFDSNLALRARLALCAASTVAVLPALWWYFHWVPHLVSTYGLPYFFMGKGFVQGFHDIMGMLPNTMGRFYESALKYVGFVVFAFGLGHAIIYRNKRVLLVFGLAVAGFLPVMLKGGETFVRHSYYLVPFIPAMALVAGEGLAKLKPAWVAFLVVSIIALEGPLNRLQDFRVPDSNRYLIELEAALDEASQRDDLFLINSGERSTPMYFAHRKGWLCDQDQWKDQAYIQDLQRKGLSHVLLLQQNADDLPEWLAAYPVRIQHPAYILLDVRQPDTP